VLALGWKTIPERGVSTIQCLAGTNERLKLQGQILYTVRLHHVPASKGACSGSHDLFKIFGIVVELWVSCYWYT